MGDYLQIKSATVTTAVQIAVINLDGRTYYTAKLAAANISNGRFEIPVKQLPAGAYLLKIADKTGEHVQVTKFTVVK